MYSIVRADRFDEDIVKLKREEPKLFNKLMGFIKEVSEHPKTGLGKPKPLTGNPQDRWAR